MMNKALGKDVFYDFVRCEEGKLVYDEGLWREATVKALQMLRRKRGHRSKQ
jgi:hypothetical protein